MPALIVTRAVIMGWIGICLFVVYLIGLQYCQYCRVQNNLSDLSLDLSNYKYPLFTVPGSYLLSVTLISQVSQIGLATAWLPRGQEEGCDKNAFLRNQI